MSDTASSSVEAYLEKLRNLLVNGGNVVGEFRGVLAALNGICITHSHEELRRIIIEDALGLKRKKDPLVLQVLKHIRKEKMRTQRAKGVFPQAYGGITAVIQERTLVARRR